MQHGLALRQRPWLHQHRRHVPAGRQIRLWAAADDLDARVEHITLKTIQAAISDLKASNSQSIAELNISINQTLEKAVSDMKISTNQALDKAVYDMKISTNQALDKAVSDMKISTNQALDKATYDMKISTHHTVSDMKISTNQALDKAMYDMKISTTQALDKAVYDMKVMQLGIIVIVALGAGSDSLLGQFAILIINKVLK